MQNTIPKADDSKQCTDSLQITIVLILCSDLSSEFHCFELPKTKQKSNKQNVKINLVELMHIVFGNGLFYSAVLGTDSTQSLQHATVMNLTFVIHVTEKKEISIRGDSGYRL